MNKVKSKEKEANKITSASLLKSYRGALLKIEEFFDAVQEKEFDVDNVDESVKLIQAVLTASERLGKAFETLSILEKKVEQDEDIKSKVRGSAKTSMLENDEL